VKRDKDGHALGQFGRTSDKEVRKQQPVTTGVLDYFPDAMYAVANVSFIGNIQHNPGKPLHWDRSKSTDEVDACGRHLIERSDVWDDDGVLHAAKNAWRSMANLQKTIEELRRRRDEERRDSVQV
jgi:hypothetical protein